MTRHGQDNKLNIQAEYKINLNCPKEISNKGDQASHQNNL